MSKFVKGLVQSELEKKLVGVTAFLVLNTMGVDGIVNNQLRGDLKKKGVRLVVVKNSLARKAFGQMGLKNTDGVLNGPCTIAFGGDSVVDIAKDFVEIVKKVKKIEIKGAYVDGVTLDAKGAIELAKMPNRRELQCQIAGLIRSPGARVAAAIMAPGRNVAGCVKTIADKEEKAA